MNKEEMQAWIWSMGVEARGVPMEECCRRAYAALSDEPAPYLSVAKAIWSPTTWKEMTGIGSAESAVLQELEKQGRATWVSGRPDGTGKSWETSGWIRLSFDLNDLLASCVDAFCAANPKISRPQVTWEDGWAVQRGDDGRELTRYRPLTLANLHDYWQRRLEERVL